jgi:hypothetical protein
VGDGVVVLQVRVAVEKSYDLPIVFQERRRRRRNDRIGGWRGPAREDDANAMDVIPPFLAARIYCHFSFASTFLLLRALIPAARSIIGAAIRPLNLTEQAHFSRQGS